MISIHAPHEGERPHQCRLHKPRRIFQSTLPTRGSDGGFLWMRGYRRNFNPRSPRGGATQPDRLLGAPVYIFQSTLPTRGSDPPLSYLSGRRTYFNPRSPRGGATLCYFLLHQRAQDFNPRSPRGGATQKGSFFYRYFVISIHAPHEGERPEREAIDAQAAQISIHAPHEGERLVFSPS